ncbi:peptide ABC transporter permease [Microvirga terrae]|uniref:Peptide ABC transporter permease n=1 Tax=Microvirga terrae TaxID=2740529 RepID=A0ABY5RQA0_9HYPH|nr:MULTISPECIES: peptide ABC transporter permease [Microvirga]MBQ0821950.1 peptide ABC transporter permease [Microvirga sp. HBU67558]UVF19443.1 peptide ABC transporter permease [Microvirga terrae]
MIRPVFQAANPSADAAAMLRRLGFAILFFAVPLAALFTRRALVVMAPLAVILLVLASVLDGSAKHAWDKLTALATSPGGIAGLVLLFWAGLSLLWTPFLPQASERLLNITGMILMGLGGFLAVPERMRSANLYLLPVGVGLAALIAVFLTLTGGSTVDPEGLSLERGMLMLVLLLWPAIAWLHSRGRNLEAIGLALAVAVCSLLTRDGLPLYGLVAGAVVFVVTAWNPVFGPRLTGLVMAGLLLFAPVLPFLLKPLAANLLGVNSPTTLALEVWRQIILGEPLRLLTGHGLETALRGRFLGLMPPSAPSTLLFEIWYELGVVGAVAGSVLLYQAVVSARGHRASVAPGIMAAFACTYALGCLGIGTTQVWWFTALVALVLIFVAIERGQFRTKRPKAVLHRMA